MIFCTFERGDFMAARLWLMLFWEPVVAFTISSFFSLIRFGPNISVFFVYNICLVKVGTKAFLNAQVLL